MPKVSPEAELANHCMQQTTRQELHILLGRVAGRVAADATALGCTTSPGDPMHELIRDPVWQFVGALAGLAALGVPVWLAVYRAHRLAYEYRLTSLVSIHTSVKERVRVLFGELEVSNPTLVLVRMVNAGREPLRATDYETPVRIQFGKDTRVLSAEVDAVAPDNLTVDFSLCEAPDSRIEYVQITLSF